MCFRPQSVLLRPVPHCPSHSTSGALNHLRQTSSTCEHLLSFICSSCSSKICSTNSEKTCSIGFDLQCPSPGQSLPFMCHHGGLCRPCIGLAIPAIRWLALLRCKSGSRQYIPELYLQQTVHQLIFRFHFKLSTDCLLDHSGSC